MDPYVDRNKIYFSAPDSDLNDEEVTMEAIFDCKAEPGPGEKEIQISVKITEITDATTGEVVRCTEKIRSVIAEVLKEHVELGHSHCRQ
jgi:hypothetical protein